MNAAFVKIWGKVAGAVTWDESRGYAIFEYASDFRNSGIELAPLKMPLADVPSVFGFPALKRKADGTQDTFKGLPGLLADVLPDRYGSELINIWLAGQGRPADSMNPVELLCFIGTRGMGALEFEPTSFAESSVVFSLEIESLVEMAARMLNDKEAFTANLRTDQNQLLTNILRVGTSAGGARPKAVIAFNPLTGEVLSGQTGAPEGFEHWIIKMDGVSNAQLGETHGYGRVEMAYYNMATACGIEMMPSQLMIENNRAHFMTKRFDRDGLGSKHHIQTFCAIQHFDFNQITSFSYEQLFQTMRELRLSYPEAEQMFRRMVFNVVARNCDDHTKNFSFRMRKGERWELAPAYDICHAYQPGHQWVSHHALSINGKRDKISREDILAVAKYANIKKAQTIVDEICDTVAKWPRFAEEVDVSSSLTSAINSTLVRL